MSDKWKKVKRGYFIRTQNPQRLQTAEFQTDDSLHFSFSRSSISAGRFELENLESDFSPIIDQV